MDVVEYQRVIGNIYGLLAENQSVHTQVCVPCEDCGTLALVRCRSVYLVRIVVL